MQRRTLLGAIAGATAATAGCAQLSETVDRATEGSRIENLGGTGHPWNGDPISVAVAYGDDVERRENFPELVEASTAFWEEHADQYADFEVEYELEPDADDPDVRVTLVSSVSSCESHDSDYRVVGCAPLITGDAPDTASVEIKSGYSDNLTQTTITHELGHTLGLGHDDDPQKIMSSDPADRVPDYETRRAIHEAYISGGGSMKEANEHHNDAQDYWENDQWSSASDAFASAADEYSSAERSYSHAADESKSIGVPNAADICESAANVADESASATSAMRNAAAAYADGDRQKAQQYWNSAQEHYDRLGEYTIPDSDDVAVELGLQ